MASSPLLLSFTFSLLFLLSLASATTNPSSPQPATTICKTTPYPGYCNVILQSNNRTGTLYDYGRFSFKRSISQATKFLRLVNKYLAHPKRLTLTATRALEDCQLMAQLNLDFLSDSFHALTSLNSTLSSARADDVQTLLSAILTNQQTCLDGLKSAQSSWTLKNGLSGPLSSDSKLFSLSLSLFTKGWVPKKKKPLPTWHSTTHRSAFRHGRVRLRRRLQSQDSDTNDDDEVLVSDMVTVSKDGTGNFSSINDAVASAPNNTDGSEGYFLIYVTKGEYEENVMIEKKKKYVMIIGDGINQTVITGNRSVVDGWTTFNSATFAVVGTGFVAVNITIRNTAGAIKHQAVALRSGADLSTFYSCSFEGYQDTLYVHSLRQFYRECDIYGTVDFIFGNAAAVFQNCNLYPRLPLDNQFNAVTAQGRTDPNQNTGISIHNCTIRAADDLGSSNGTTMTFLGRPWKEYSRTVYMQTYMDSLINPLGWREWNATFALSTLYYGEFNNRGPGSNTTQRVRWPGYHVMNTTDAGNFTTSVFLLADDWLPDTGVPFTSSLV